MPESLQGQQIDRTALILYGSETGNSEDVAEELGRVVERLHFETRVSEMNIIENLNELLTYTVVIFAISTTGQGEFPKNARKFWQSLLRRRPKELPDGLLSHVNFTSFGLGDSSYPRFNWSARKLHKRLEQLGAQEVYPRGEADEQHEEGIDGTFLSWSLDLRTHLLSSYPLPDGVLPLPADAILPFKYQLVLVEDNKNIPKSRKASYIAKQNNMDTDHETPLCTQLQRQDPDENTEPFPASFPPPQADLLDVPRARAIRLVENKRVTPETHWQDVRKLTFETSGEKCGRLERDKDGQGWGTWNKVYHERRECELICGPECREYCALPCHETYHPGDTVTIYPKNFPSDVETLISNMSWNRIADLELVYQSTDPTAPNLIPVVPNIIPIQSRTERLTLRKLLIHNLDINAIPKRQFFNVLSTYTDNQMHKARLLELGSPEFLDEYYDYATRPRRSILETLQEFSSVSIPWKDAAALFPKIRGRQFSIASGGVLKQHQNDGYVRLELLIAIVKYKTVLKKVRQGLCSRYVATLQPGTTINVTFDSNQKFDGLSRKYPERPIIMIAPGTGIAPCRALIWERAEAEIMSQNELHPANLEPHEKPENIQGHSIESTLADSHGEIQTPQSIIAHKPTEGLYKENRAIRAGDKGPLKNFTFGPSLLFFGNRNAEADYFFRDDWQVLNLQVFTAFSRDQEQKIYIQDIIKREGVLVNQRIKDGAVIYVCGSSGNMPKAVKEALIVAMEGCTLKKSDWILLKPEDAQELANEEAKRRLVAEKRMEELEREGRYIQETW